MNLRDDEDFSPSPNLLPFGGFEVATLLSMLASGDRTSKSINDDTMFQPITSSVSSGWLRSKIMAG